ncbi:MAG: DUF302 domain-containing protein [Candidatus Sedimenticola sp. (ex Thyasira tokunagai)]
MWLRSLRLVKAVKANSYPSNDDNKYVSVMMPCSISVYEKQDGNTSVASMNMSLMSKVMGSEVGAILKRVAEEDAAILEFLEQ